MLEIDVAVPESNAEAERLPALFTAALGRPMSEAQMLSALATIAPGSALDALVVDAAIGSRISARELSEVVSTALRAIGSDDPARPRLAGSILRTYWPHLNRPAAADVAGALAASDVAEELSALDKLLERFPTDPAILRVAIRMEAARTASPGLDALLTRLGLADPTPATASYVQRARGTLAPATQVVTARVAFLSSFTIDGLVPFVDLAARAHGVAPQTYVAPFNSWMRDAIDPTSGLRAFEPDITFLAIGIDDLVPELAGALGADDLAAAADTALARVLAAVDAYRAWSGSRPLVIHRFHSAFAPTAGILDGNDGPSRGDWLASLNMRLAAAARERSGCFTLDITEAVLRAGASFADNAKLRHIAGMRLPPTGLAAIAEAYVRFIVPACGLTKKCVVLDLDNTLWGGVVGEDGKDGIRLSATAAGAEFVEFQRFLKALNERGILLAVNSKNNADDALEIIRTHEAMVLTESHFSAVRINWKPKSENMLDIARELNIGVDALVFVDDNPDERERMRQMLPGVLTVEMPRDPTQYRATLERLPELQSLAITDDDRKRAAQYETARLRTRALEATGDVDEYLRSLEIRVTIERASRASIVRIAQLFAKTNQFNATTRRYTTADVEAFASDPTVRLWTLSSNDRFGDHGLVAVALARTSATVWELDSFLMSCRVIGYGIEGALLAHVVAAARAAGAERIDADFIETKKNAPAKDLYERHGFVRSFAKTDRERWTFALTESLPPPKWITITL